MLLPTDPGRRPALWDNFSAKMASGGMAFIVHCGEVSTELKHQSILDEGADHLVNAFRKADVVRFGADRGQAIGPFFALTIAEGMARLAEFAIDPAMHSNTNATIQGELQSLALNLFFECRDITDILVPFVIPEWELNEWKVVKRESGMSLHRVA